MKFDRDKKVQEQLIEATRTVRAYAGSDCSRAVIVMLDALGQSYAMDLIHCSVDDLVRIQAAIRQVYALRNILDDEGMNDPKI